MKPVALITGGRQGIGLGIAAKLIGAGYALALDFVLGVNLRGAFFLGLSIARL